VLHSDHCETRHGTEPSSQGCWLQDVVSRSPPTQGFPLSAAGFSTSRCRIVWPPPQVRSHSCHSDQADSRQSSEDVSTSGSQPSVCDRCPSQGRPSPTAGVATRRLRVRCRNSALQRPHSDHSARVQFAALTPLQAWVLHGSISDSEAEHGRPPFSECLRIVRCRWRSPPPHLRVQGVQAIQEETRQSRDSLVPLPHTSVSKIWPEQSAPPRAAGSTISLWRSRWNSFVSPHSPQEPQSPTTQSCGASGTHGFWQRWLSSRAPSHGKPPHRFGVWMARVRAQRPLQSLGGDHSDQSPKEQFTGPLPPLPLHWSRTVGHSGSSGHR